MAYYPDTIMLKIDKFNYIKLFHGLKMNQKTNCKNRNKRAKHITTTCFFKELPIGNKNVTRWLNISIIWKM